MGGVFFDDFNHLGFEQSLPLCARGRWTRPICRVVASPTALCERGATFNLLAVAVDLIWFMIAVHYSACKLADALSRFLCLCHRWCAGNTIGNLRLAVQKLSYEHYLIDQDWI